MGYRWIILGAVLLLLLSACAGEITPTPDVTPTPPPSFTPTDTNTPRPAEPRPTATGPRALPPRQQTLPPTFTPTFTPSITPTFTPSYTPTPTFTPSPVPEDILCTQISIQTNATNGTRFTNNNLAIPFVILLNNERVLIRLTITGEDAEEPIIDGLLQGGRAPQIVAPQPSEFPESGRYDWTVRLYDTDREDMCDGKLTSFFQLDLDTATFTPSPTATNTPTATIDPEQTEEVEVTPEVRFIIVTATPEPTSTAPSRNELFATLTAQAERRGE